MSYLLLHWHDVAYLLLAIIFIVIYVVHFLPGMKESKLRKILGVPDNFRLVSLLPVGVPAKLPASTRKSMEQIRCHNLFTIDKKRDVSAEQALRQKLQGKKAVSFAETPYKVSWYEAGNPLRSGG